MIKHYFLLLRVPNLFTVPSNILAGYFSVAQSLSTNLSVLSLLVASSVLLYISGIVFNDYFDIEVDRKERPFRPLPSEKVSKRTAFVAAAMSMVAANGLAFMVSTLSFTVAIILSVIILSYDYQLKQTILGPILMGSARTLNVLLGASAILPAVISVQKVLPEQRLAILCISMFLYVLSITLLSRMEVGPAKPARTVTLPFVVIFGVIAIMIIASGFRVFQVDIVVSLSLFVGIIIITFKRTIVEGSSTNIQSAIKTLVLSIIVLDSIFISGTLGLYYGLPILLLIIPPIFISRKLYVT
jgi:4-hydroxybenzoate polyprenyltransferase